VDPNTTQIALQAIAALFAVALGVLLSRRLRHDLAAAVVGLQLFAIPILGMGFFVLHPSFPASPPGIVWVLLVPLAVVVVALGVWWRRHARQVDMAFKTPSMFTFQTRVGVVLVACTVLIVSAYLFLFEPVLAVVNVVAYLLWALVWIPRTLRTYRSEESIAVPASATRVWEFLVDAANWPQFQVGLEDVQVAPPGPLGVGSRITTHRTVPLIGSRAKVPEVVMRYESVVIEIDPPISYKVVALDRLASTKTQLTPELSGTVVTMRSQFALSIADGIAGQAFRWPAAMARFRATSILSLERLREVLSTPDPT
jgi:hypothetical protein